MATEGGVRALHVVLRPEDIEASLLRAPRRLRRPTRFRLERSVHALVRAVLLRLTGQDPLMRDGEPEPPDVEL